MVCPACISDEANIGGHNAGPGKLSGNLSSPERIASKVCDVTDQSSQEGGLLRGPLDVRTVYCKVNDQSHAGSLRRLSACHPLRKIMTKSEEEALAASSAWTQYAIFVECCHNLLQCTHSLTTMWTKA